MGQGTRSVKTFDRPETVRTGRSRVYEHSDHLKQEEAQAETSMTVHRLEETEQHVVEEDGNWRHVDSLD
jgi:hypothetical protein